MKNENKKLGLYVGIALLVGGLGFLAYKKFSVQNQNDITEETETNTTAPSKWSMKNPFSSNPANQLTVGQIGIKAPAFTTDLLNSFK
jgi:hypothetical protein